MEAKSLRIGNYLMLNGTVQKVESIFTYGENEPTLMCDPGEAERNLTEFKPILITKEWLLEVGFTGDYGEYKKGDLNLDNEYTDKDEWVVFFSGENIKPTESKNEYHCRYYVKANIKFVHQLQNLYYCHYEEELIINKYK